MGRVAVIGDVGGHPDQLRHALGELGVVDGRLPDDLTVVQVGDLVDRGPDSDGVLELVDAIGSDRWIQLVGNHDAQYLSGGTRFWDESVPESAEQTLRRWDDSGFLQVAAVIRTGEGEEFLVSHAGVSAGWWTELGEPMTPTTAMWRLDELPCGSLSSRTDGPLWTEAGELYESWMEFHGRGGFVPFGQIHGHSSVVRYQDQTWRCTGRIRQRSGVDWAARHTRTRVGGREFIGVDPKHGRTAAEQWSPLVLAGAEIVAPRRVASGQSD